MKWHGFIYKEGKCGKSFHGRLMAMASLPIQGCGMQDGVRVAGQG